MPRSFEKICTNSFLATALLATTLLFLSACSKPLAIVGVGAGSLQTVRDDVQPHDIYFATTRARSTDDNVFFGGARQRHLTTGKITVGVPPRHQPGQIELARKDENFDPKLHFSVAFPVVYQDTPAFVGQLQAALRARPAEHRNVLIYVHGYNTSFSNAATRFTQFVHDTGFKGVPVLFTWASRARTVDYVYDLNSALQSRFKMAELALAMEKLHVNEFSIVAHSMGNLATLETLTVLNAMPEFNPNGNLRAIVLAAPDVDIDLFTEHINALDRLRQKIYVLISRDDTALGVSKLVAGGVNRVGVAGPDRLAGLGIKVIDLSGIQDRSKANHIKFAESPAIVQLIGTAIRSGNTLSSQPEELPLRNVVGSIFGGLRQSVSGGGVLILNN